MPYTPPVTPFGKQVVVSIADYGAVGDGTNDDALAMQAAITALGTAGGTIVVPAGVWTWKSVPKLTASVTGVLRIIGLFGATIQLTQTGPRAFDFNRTADHQTFQNIEISDLVIDGGAAVTGKHHVVVGSWVAGVTQLRMNFDRIRISRVKTVNVNSAAGSVATTERPNIYLIAAQSGTAEATQNFCTRIVVEDCDFNGGAHGVVIGGFNTQGNGAAGSVGTNTWVDDILLRKVRHDTGIVAPSAYWASANFSLGAVGSYGRCVIRDCRGVNAGDPGVEADGWDYFLADNVLIEDAGVSGFLWTNFDNPRTPGEQQYVWRNCHYRRVNSTSGIGWLIQNSTRAIALGHATLRDCSFYQSRAAEVPAQAIRLNSATAGGIASLLVDGFKAVHKSFSYSGGGNQQWTMIDCTNLTGTTKLTFRSVRATVAGTRSGSGQIINTILAVGGGTLHVDIDDFAWSSDVSGQSNDTHWAFMLGTGYTTTLHGVARRVKALSVTGDATPRGFYVWGTATLTISPDFRIEDFDTSTFPGPLIVYQSGTQNSDKLYIDGAGIYQTVTLSGTWVVFGSGTHAPVYKKHASGRVTMAGLASAGAANSVLTTLPVGCRPASTLFFVLTADTGSSTRVRVTATVESNGVVTIYDNGTGTGNYVSLSGIDFYTGE